MSYSTSPQTPVSTQRAVQGQNQTPRDGQDFLNEMCISISEDYTKVSSCAIYFQQVTLLNQGFHKGIL